MWAWWLAAFTKPAKLSCIETANAGDGVASGDGTSGIERVERTNGLETIDDRDWGVERGSEQRVQGVAMKRLLRMIVLGVVAIGACSYGMLAAERELPPYRWMVVAYYELLPYYDEARLLVAPPGGRFMQAPRVDDRGSPFTAEQRSRIAELQAIGYDAGTVLAPEQSGVTVYDRDRAYAGLNLYSDGHKPQAILMDMNGREIHRWHLPFEDAFPNLGPAREADGRQYWRRVRLLPNGDLLAIYEGNGLVKIDSQSRLLWAYPGGAHHDLDVGAGGNIYVLTRTAEIVPFVDPIRPVLHDFITVLDQNGRMLSRVSLLLAIVQSDYAAALSLRIRKPDSLHRADLLHTNTLEILDGSLADAVPAFAAGNVLISIRELSVIAVIDMVQRKIVWAQSGVWTLQHQPTVLDNGNLLLFDNLGDGGQSQVLELDPVTLRTAWAYRGSEHPFYSSSCGSNQRLPNGNTLITESDNGRAFEVTPDESIVWEYYTPNRAGEGGRFIATLFEVIRLEPDIGLTWLPRPVPQRAGMVR